MPVVKGGVWTNIEDEVLKAAVSKYGLNQWARVSSLLARKTPKQCKSRWSEWIDPGIRKVEWSKEEDEKLLHLAKLMPTQWRTIAPIVSRTTTQCLERYQKLLDIAEERENSELGLGGPGGGETAAPSADDVRRLRPGELDPDPESKPARPDTIDLDEDEKEMLSEARARLANTQGKKAKRKARERQLEESRRLALLQKRRELKNAGINIKITNRKKGQMDYNADIPFEKPAAPGFYDTKEELERNEHERGNYDPRKQQLAIKRKGEQEEEPNQKRHKGDKNGPPADFSAAIKAGHMQKIREAEQNSKRRALVLPAPQVGESELEDIVKMGLASEQANQLARQGENETTKGLVGNYSNMVASTPIRTPRASPQQDHIANEIRNIRALTETQSSLLGGENTPLHETTASTSFEGATPGKHNIVTPNPMATPFRQANGAPFASSRAGSGATPLRTPRDGFAINQDGYGQLPSATPREMKLQERTVKSQLRSQLASLPKPKETEWELELPEEQKDQAGDGDIMEEDASERDRRNTAIRKAEEEIELKRRTQVLQRGLPVIPLQSLGVLQASTASIEDPIRKAITEEMTKLIVNDNTPGQKSTLEKLDDDLLSKAREEIQRELPSELPDLALEDNKPLNPAIFPVLYNAIEHLAEKNHAVEKKLAVHLGGYQQRAKTLRQKISEAAETLQATKLRVETARTAQIGEEAAMASRLDHLREEVMVVNKREREAQEYYRAQRDELESLGVSTTNGVH